MFACVYEGVRGTRSQPRSQGVTRQEKFEPLFSGIASSSNLWVDICCPRASTAPVSPTSSLAAAGNLRRGGRHGSRSRSGRNREEIRVPGRVRPDVAEVEVEAAPNRCLLGEQ